MGGLILLRQKHYGGQVDWRIHGLVDSWVVGPSFVVTGDCTGGGWLLADSRLTRARAAKNCSLHICAKRVAKMRLAGSD